MAKYFKVNGMRQTKFDLMYTIKQIDPWCGFAVYSCYLYDEYVAHLRFLVTERPAKVVNNLSMHDYKDLCKAFGVKPKY